MPKRYRPKLKFQVIKELLSSDKSIGELSRSYGIHPNTIHKWEDIFNKKGQEIFEKDGDIVEYERRISELEQLLGKKEVEIALLKNFLNPRK